MDINSIAALSAAVAAFFSFVAIILTCFQLRQFRFAHGVDLIFDLDRQFQTPDLLKARRLSAIALMYHKSTEDLDEVLDFFETVGILVRRNAVDAEIAWSYFSYWVLRYADLTKGHIEERRKAELDETYWQDFELLVNRLTKIEIRKRHLKSLPHFSPEQIFSPKQRDEFLAEERSGYRPVPQERWQPLNLRLRANPARRGRCAKSRLHLA
jgi:hypothetical protein